MIEASRKSARAIDLVRRVQDTQVFLRMAVIELRGMAEEAPEIAPGLRHLAKTLEAEAEDLSRGASE